jgi:hypothetical protein
MFFSSVPGSALIWLSWIRICGGNANPNPGEKKLTKIYKKPDKQPFKIVWYVTVRRYVLRHINYNTKITVFKNDCPSPR